jgi:hypothetical protein
MTMATDADDPENEDELLLNDPVDPDDPEGDDRGEDDGADPNVNDADEETLTFGDEADEQNDDSKLVKHLRNEIRERDRRLAEAARTAPKPEKIEVGPKPTLAGCEYDEDRYDVERDAWEERKAKAARQDQAATAAGEEEKQVWAGELQRYNESKSKLAFADVEDAEETVKAALDTAQQATLLMAADDPARLTYALGKHPAKLAELAAEKNPLKLAAKIAKLEGTLKVVKGRARAIDPDTPERGSARVSSQGKDKTLEKLEKDAERTGDRTRLIAYKNSRKGGK